MEPSRITASCRQASTQGHPSQNRELKTRKYTRVCRPKSDIKEMPCANDSLGADQRAIMERIVAFGRSAGFSEETVELAVQIAMQESSLGRNMVNPTSSARGLFQYTEGTWNDRHSDLGDRFDQDNQIFAMFRDLAAYEARYAAARSSGAIPSDMSFGEYAYMRHHDGWNYSDFDNSPGAELFHSFMDFCLNRIPVETIAPGGGDTTYIVEFEDYSWLDYWLWDQDLHRFRAGEGSVSDPVDVTEAGYDGWFL